jgi:hypothetical protein
VLTEQKYDDIRARLEHSPQKSLRHLAEETRVVYLKFAVFLRTNIQHMNVTFYIVSRNAFITWTVFPACAVIWVAFFLYCDLFALSTVPQL